MNRKRYLRAKRATGVLAGGRRAAATALALAAAYPLVALAAPAVGSASASPAPVTAATAGVIYDEIPTPLPGNLPSLGYEATSTSEFGGVVSFAGQARTNPLVTVIMSSWGCQTGGDATCKTTPGSTFSEPITLNVYNPGPATEGSAPGSKITSVTKTFNIPYRPSENGTHCTGKQAGEWYDSTDRACYWGLDTPISFQLTGVTLPDEAVITLAYNTTNHGYAPYGPAPCTTSSGGCGYDSLNVAVTNPPAGGGAVAPSVGSDPLPNDAYVNSTWSGAYCDSSNPGIGHLALDASPNPCWIGYQPAIEVQAATPTSLSARPSVAQVLPGLSVNLQLSAVLTAGASPVAGEPVTFTAGGQKVCTATTGPDGTASCGSSLTGVLQSVLANGYSATFAGEGVLQPSAATAPVALVGPLGL